MDAESTTNSVASQQDMDVLSILTERECCILRMIFSGMSSMDVAESIGICKRTVDFDLSRAYAKLGVANRYSAYKRAVDMGIVRV